MFPQFLQIRDTPCGDVSPAFLLFCLLGVALASIYLIWEAHQARKAKWVHALDTVRLKWLEDYDAQVLHANDAWCVLIDGKVIAIEGVLRDAIDKARKAYP